MQNRKLNKNLDIAKNKRLFIIDFLRFLAIILMIIFHFCYDLIYFGWADWEIFNDFSWILFRNLIVSLFLLSMGVSMSLSYANNIDWKKFFKRLLLLGLSSLAVTLVSILLFPNSWIYFGILHFIFIASILSMPLIRYPKIALVLGISIIIINPILPNNILLNNLYLIFSTPKSTQDFVSIIPWLGVVLIGIYLSYSKLLQILEVKIQSIFKHKKTYDLITKISKFSLIIYLLHQPLMFIFFMPIKYLSEL